MSIINYNVPVLRTPTSYDSAFNFSTDTLPTLQGVTIPAGSDLETTVGISNLPLLITSREGPLRSLSIMMSHSPGGTAGDTFTIQVAPAWYAAPLSFSAKDENSQWRSYSFSSDMKLISRTHTVIKDDVHKTLIELRDESSATVISKGSETTTPTPGRIALVAPAFRLNLVAGATDPVTLINLSIWGSFKESS